ncbi:piggyBac transposable element-derived protein 3-like, partial [Aphis craccivora]
MFHGKMQRRRAEKMLTMLPPGKDSSESSDDDSVESYHSIGEIICESPLPIEAIENDVDELLRDVELNLIDEFLEDFEDLQSITSHNALEKKQFYHLNLQEGLNVCREIKTNRKIDHMKFNWVAGKKMNFEVNVPEYEFHTQQDHVLTPVEYLKKNFSDDLFELIVEQTNLYSVAKSGKSINLTVNELQDFLSIELWMGVSKLPTYTDYWSHLMSYEKVRPLIDIIRQNCLNQEQGKRFSIDEMMVPYKGKKAGSRRQYIKSKPKKWGFKFFVRSGINGLVYDFFLTVEKTHSMITILFFGLGPKVILALVSTIPEKILSIVYFDNFFSSPELVYYLREKYETLSLGTVQQNRLRQCPLLEEKQLKKKGR